MADIMDLNEFITLVTVGENTPPTVRARGTAHITGPAPTGAWSGNPNALALDSGDGSWKWKDQQAMRKFLYFHGGKAWTWSGTALVAVSGSGGGAAAAELPAGTLGSVMVHDGTAWLALAPPVELGTYGIVCTVSAAGPALAWRLSGSGDPMRSADEGRADREKRAAGGGPSVPPSGSTGPKGPSGGAGGGRLTPDERKDLR